MGTRVVSLDQGNLSGKKRKENNRFVSSDKRRSFESYLLYSTTLIVWRSNMRAPHDNRTNQSNYPQILILL